MGNKMWLTNWSFSRSSLNNEHASSVSDTDEHSLNEASLRWGIAHCIGFGACWGWVHIAFFSTVFWGSGSEILGLNAWLLNVASNGIAMILFGLFMLRRKPLHTHKRGVIAIVALTVVGTLMLSSARINNELSAYGGAIASGVGTAGLLLLWAESYSVIPPVVAKKYTIPCSMLIGSAFYLLICALPVPLAILMEAVLPIVSIILFRISQAYLEAPKEQSEAAASDSMHPTDAGVSLKRSIPLKFIIFIAIYCLAPGFMRGHTEALPFATTYGIGSEMFAGVAFVMIVVATLSILLFGSSKIDLAYKLIVPLMAAGLLLLSFLEPGQEALAAIAIMSGYLLLEMFVWASLADIASNSRAPSASIFGFGKSGMNIGLLVGSFLGMFFGSSSTMLLVGISVLIVYLFIVIESIASPLKSASLPLGKGANATSQKVDIAEAARQDLADVYLSFLNVQCEAIAEQYDLSKREIEVLNLLARGRSLQATADILGVAYSTIKTHTNRIYAKTGVHSRQELIALIETGSENER